MHFSCVLCCISYNLSMDKKILRYQLNTLFILTTLNLIYFYYRDNLPDNFFEINYQNSSINFFTYYFFSMLANFGYWCGIWITLSFLTFAVLNSLVFTKKKDVKNQAVIAVLLPLGGNLLSHFSGRAWRRSVLPHT